MPPVLPEYIGQTVGGTLSVGGIGGRLSVADVHRRMTFTSGEAFHAFFTSYPSSQTERKHIVTSTYIARLSAIILVLVIGAATASAYTYPGLAATPAADP